MVLSQEVEDGDKAILHEERWCWVIGINHPPTCRQSRSRCHARCCELSLRSTALRFRSPTAIDIINGNTLQLVFLTPPFAYALGTNPTTSSHGFIRLPSIIGACASDTTLGSGRRLGLCCVYGMSDLRPPLGSGIPDEMLM